MIENKEAYFKTNVLLKSIIGKDLINNDNIAVLELVKNSYDAHSSNVKVIFKNIKNNDDLINDYYSENSSKIIIKDEGVGMDEDDVRNKWLNIAFSEKRYTKKENNRLFAGAKGVGRFSCDRLGSFLDIYTKKKNGSIIHLFIDWRAFEIENKIDLSIQQIPLSIEEISDSDLLKTTGYSIENQGTILEISKLRSQWVSFEKRKKITAWNSKKLLELRTSLAKLIHPNQNFTDDNFRIDLEANEFLEEDKNVPTNEKINDKIQNLIFQKLDFNTTVIETKLINNGKEIETILKDKDRIIFNLIEKNIDFSLLKDLEEVKITLYFLNQYAKIYFKKMTGIHSVNYGSVFLFVNNFRISPLGDEGDDWLNLEVRSTQGNKRYLASRNILGQIVIQDTKNIFQIISNRQGIDKNDSYKELIEVNTSGTGEKYKGLFFKTIRRLEKFVVDILDWDKPLTEQEGDDDKVENNLMGEFQKKVNSPDWKFNSTDEKYAINQDIKDRKVIELIYNLINVKNENIVKLYINEELIKTSVEEKEQEAKDLVDSVLRKLSNINFDRYDEVQNVIDTAQLDLDKINTQISKVAFGLFNTDFVKNAAKNIESLKEKLSQIKEDLEKEKLQRDKLSLELAKLKMEMEYAEVETIKIKEIAAIEKKEKEKAIQKNKENEIVIHKLEQEKKLEIKKADYFFKTRKHLSKDADALIHHIKNTQLIVKASVSNLIGDIQNNELNTNQIITSLSNIMKNVDKTLKSTNLITNADLKDNDNEVVELVSFFSSYFQTFSEINHKNRIKFSVNSDLFTFNKMLSVLELTLIIDNLEDNAAKWNAKNVFVEIKQVNDGLCLKFYDDGDGLIGEYLENPEKIFQLRETSSPNGSGIGLYVVRDMLKQMDASIKFLGNNLKLKGAAFEIYFN